jgi:hypothetical protein
MRDDEDHIRQFMPVLRRIVILVAVLTAIPVVMWTITAFVRTYVGPPKTPTFQRIADTTPGGTPGASAAPSAKATTGSTQASPGPIVEAKAAATDADASAPMPDSNAAPADGAANAASSQGAPQDPAFPNVTVPNMPAAPATNAAASNAASPGMAPAAGTANSAAPNAPAYAAPGDASDGGGMQVAAQQPAPTNWPSSQPPAVDSLPPGQPIAGVVPLPRKRPKTFELAQGGPIPLPTARPGAAGAGAQPAPATPFDWLQHVFHAASDGSGQPPSGDSSGYTDTPH